MGTVFCRGGKYVSQTKAGAGQNGFRLERLSHVRRKWLIFDFYLLDEIQRVTIALAEGPSPLEAGRRPRRGL